MGGRGRAWRAGHRLAEVAEDGAGGDDGGEAHADDPDEGGDAPAQFNAKRQHCKSCRETGKRFDARKLGYRIGQFKGNRDYNGSRIGCYWHDPWRFNREVS